MICKEEQAFCEMVRQLSVLSSGRLERPDRRCPGVQDDSKKDPGYKNCTVLPIIHLKYKLMAIVKVIEVIASSEKGIDDALQNAVREAAKTIRNIDSVFVKDIKAHVKDDKIISYGVICKISFRLD
jgi:flavin-binding protein dodecin